MTAPFDKTNTVSTMDQWLACLVEDEATPLLVWAQGPDGPILLFDEEILETPLKKVLELLFGMDMVEDEV